LQDISDERRFPGCGSAATSNSPAQKPETTRFSRLRRFLPGVKHFNAGRHEVGHVPRDYDHSVNHCRCRDQRVPIRARIWHVQLRATLRHCGINGKYATGKRWQHMVV
jgi:hypothetical protein